MKKKHLKISISELKINKKNPKLHEEGLIQRSIEELGFVDDIVIDEKNVILAGHGRLKALKKLGYKEVDVIRITGWSKEQKEKYLILSNKAVEAGGWDNELLKDFDEDFLLDVGFNNLEIEKLFQENVEEDDFDVEKEAGKIKKPRSNRGDVYALGDHRLMCGDSACEEDVGVLMGGKLANMIFTDPPYNVNYSYHSDKYHGQVIFNDNLKDDDFYNLLFKAFCNIEKFSAKQMSWYIFCGYSTEPIFRRAIDAAGLYFQQQIIWLKEHFVLARGQAYHRAYEPVLFGKKKKGTAYRNKDMRSSTDMLDLDFDKFQDRLDIWFLHRDKTTEYKHPTQKPVRVSERAIKMSSKRNDIVLDLFGGGGASLIACEQLHRKCRMMELDPIYCDVIIKRYEEFSGEKAKKIKK